MGKKNFQRKLFCDFSLAERIPEDHLLRRIAEVVDFSFIYDLCRPYYSHTGKPSIDPVVLFKMALIGYFFGITSERKLAAEISLNLSYLWFLGYELDEETPNHSVLSKARTRFGVEAYRAFFRRIVLICVEAGLVEGGEIFVDATLIPANTSFNGCSRALVEQLREGTEDYITRLFAENPSEENEDNKSVKPIVKPSIPTADSKSAEEKQSDRTKPRRRRRFINDRLASKTDPESALVSYGGPARFAYKGHVGIDGGRARIITSVILTDGAVGEEHYLNPLLDSHERTVGKRPREAIADTRYGTATNYKALKAKGILPTIPFRKRSSGGAGYSIDMFTYNPKENTYLCPQRKLLYPFCHRKTGHIIYRAKAEDCKACETRTSCTRSERRKLIRSPDTELLEQVALHLSTPKAKINISRRKVYPETIFAEAKRWHGLAQARLKSRWKVEIQVLLTAAVQNLKRLAKINGLTPESIATARKMPKIKTAASFLTIFDYILCLGLATIPKT